MQWKNFSKMKIGFLVMLVSTSGTTHYNQQCRCSAAPGRLSCPTVPLTGREDNGACFWFSSFLHTWKIGILFDCHLNKNRNFNLKKDPAWYSYSSLLVQKKTERNYRRLVEAGLCDPKPSRWCHWQHPWDPGILGENYALLQNPTDRESSSFCAITPGKKHFRCFLALCLTLN